MDNDKNTASPDLSGGSNFTPLYRENGQPETSFASLTGTGYLRAQVTAGGGAVPVEGASVTVSRIEDGREILLMMMTTDRSGLTDTAALPAPDIGLSEAPDPSSRPYTEYIVSASADGFYPVSGLTVPVFPTVRSVQPIAMVPLPADYFYGERR